MECAAILDICKVLEVDDGDSLKQGKVLLTRIVSMLTKLGEIR